MAGQWKEILDSDLLGVANGVAQLDGTGKLDSAQIPSIPVGNLSGVISTSKIPDLDAAKIVSGSFDVARIPNLDATKITSGEFGEDRIPMLAQSKITGLISALSGKVQTSRKINGHALTADIDLKTQDIIESVTSLPASGVEGEIVVHGDKLYLWKVTS